MHIIVDFILHLDVHLAALTAAYGVWVYAILFAVIFCEIGLVVTPFLPGDSLLFVAGTVAMMPSNDIDVNLLALLMAIAAVLGNMTNYSIGRLFGERLFRNPNSKIFKRSYLEKTHDFYRKYGGSTVFIARFVPIVRTFAPFVAGMGRMSYRRFALFTVSGGVLWVAIFVYAGYFFGGLAFVKNHLSLLMLAIVVISIIPGVIEAWRIRRKNRRAAQAAERAPECATPAAAGRE